MALAMVDHGYILLRCGVGGLGGGGEWHCGSCHGWPWIHSAEVQGWGARGGGGSGTVALAMVGHGYILLRCMGGWGGYRFENWNTTTVLPGFLALVQIVTGLLDYEKKMLLLHL